MFDDTVASIEAPASDTVALDAEPPALAVVDFAAFAAVEVAALDPLVAPLEAPIAELAAFPPPG